MDDRTDAAGSYDVFISYSRRNKDHVATLVTALEQAGFQVWLDTEAIPLSSQWWQEIKSGIENTPTFLLILTPHYLSSPECTLEAAYAIKMQKQLVPLLYESVEGDALSNAFGKIAAHKVDGHLQQRLEERNLLQLAQANWVAIQQSNWINPSLFDAPVAFFEKLGAVIRTDLPFLKEGSWLLARAVRWEQQPGASGLLLAGDELRAAEQWLYTAKLRASPATSLHERYIAASVAEREQQARLAQAQHDEKLRLEERARLNRQLYERIRGLVLRSITATLGFGLAFVPVIFFLYFDPQGERLTQRLMASFLSLVMGAFFGLAALLAIDLPPLLRQFRPYAAYWLLCLLGAWLACACGLLLFVYIYYGEPQLRWLPLSALLLAGGFALASATTRGLSLWQALGLGAGGSFLALLLPWLIDPSHAPILFITPRQVDLALPLNAWIALALAGGAYFPEFWASIQQLLQHGLRYSLR